MPRSNPADVPSPRRAGRSGSAVWVGLLALILVAQSGCTLMWKNVRERERLFALETARNQIRHGRCVRGLAGLDRAQARLDLGAYARESTAARARCYEKLEFSQLASGHRRLIADFYTTEPMAFPEADGSSVFRIQSLASGGYEAVPSALTIPQPRYSPYARRSRIVGRVVIAFELGSDGEPEKIRVLEMPHPLLASWAIEAVARATMESDNNIVLMPGLRYVTTFLFESRWATREGEEQDS